MAAHDAADALRAEGLALDGQASLGADGNGIGLGIDAGGTYTDAVVYDPGARAVLAKAKSLTTYHDLVEGIRGALAQLPPELLGRVGVTSLSTTLATNSIVEGRGHRVGLIVLSPWDWFAESIDHQPSIRVPGCVDVTGEVLEPLDEETCRAAIRRLLDVERCAAIVVAGYATTRNPAQANRVRELVLEAAEVPVMCAHEVSRRLDAVQGARTAVANARLLPVIQHLIDSVHSALAERAVQGRLMVVKGDGTPVDESVARSRPVETILSGPAASASGARILTGLDDALVIDIGGTTTDCAILRDGRVAVARDGARVGPSVMSVDVVEICTVGLGGDSRIGFTREREITLGPQRNIPLSYLAARHPAVAEFLQTFDIRRCKGSLDATALDVLVRGGQSRLRWTEPEQRLLDALADGPLPAVRAAEILGVPSHVLLPLSRLESSGVIKRGALTPTDLLHVDGRFVRWDREAASRALALFSAMFGRPSSEVLRAALRVVTRRIFQEIVRREVSAEDARLHDLPPQWSYLLDRAFDGNGDCAGLGVRLSLRRPIVALGAPAQALVPPVREHLDAEIVVPEDADVANAVGAIATEVVVREEVTIAPGVSSAYVLYATDERVEFADLARATERATELARERARQRALEAGAAAPKVTVTRGDSSGLASDGGQVFLERRVTAVALGAALAHVPPGLAHVPPGLAR